MEPHEQYLYGMNLIMKKYGGYTVQTILDMSITQFNALINMIIYDSELEQQAYDKAKRKNKHK